MTGSDWKIADSSGVGVGRPAETAGLCNEGTVIVAISQRLGWIGVDVGTHTVKLAQVVRDGASVRLHRAAVIQRPTTWTGEDSLAQEQPITSQPEIRRGARMRRFQRAQCDLRIADECVPIAKSECAAGQRPGAADDHRRRAGRGFARSCAIRWSLIFGKWRRLAATRAPMRST